MRRPRALRLTVDCQPLVPERQWSCHLWASAAEHDGCYAGSFNVHRRIHARVCLVLFSFTALPSGIAIRNSEPAPADSADRRLGRLFPALPFCTVLGWVGMGSRGSGAQVFTEVPDKEAEAVCL
mmetsp:Transcript_19083/g.25641  ORF Transcript_19083/g.25641 Transcript_19083/m.25641 type:complete len:124 (-) Transcript_19083:21-392(-)